MDTQAYPSTQLIFYALHVLNYFSQGIESFNSALEIRQRIDNCKRALCSFRVAHVLIIVTGADNLVLCRTHAVPSKWDLQPSGAAAVSVGRKWMLLSNEISWMAQTERLHARRHFIKQQLMDSVAAAVAALACVCIVLMGRSSRFAYHYCCGLWNFYCDDHHHMCVHALSPAQWE